MTFVIEITQNKAPQITNQLNATTAHGNRTTNFALTTPLFTDIEGNSFTYTYTVSPSVAFITFSNTTNIITVVAGVNDAGTYNLSVTAVDVYTDTGSTVNSCIITIYNNEAPVTSETFSNITMIAYYDLMLDYDATLFSDFNGDTISYGLTNNGTAWIYNDVANLRFYGTPTNSYVGTFIMTLTAYDAYGGITVYSYYVTVQQNYAPAVTTSFPSYIYIQ